MNRICIAIGLFAAFFLFWTGTVQASLTAPQPAPPDPLATISGPTVRLLDDSGNPVKGVLLKVWLKGGNKYLESVRTNEQGEAAFSVKDGSYFIGGNLDPLVKRPEYIRQVEHPNDVRLFLISKPTELRRGEVFVIRVESSQYLDVADFGHRVVGSFVVKQGSIGLRTEIHAGSGIRLVRMFLPMRLTYRIGPVEDSDFMMLPEVYASPGFCYFIGAL